MSTKTSSGKAGFSAKWRERTLNAVVGLVVAMLAFVILSIFPSLGTLAKTVTAAILLVVCAVLGFGSAMVSLAAYLVVSFLAKGLEEFGRRRNVDAGSLAMEKLASGAKKLSEEEDKKESLWNWVLDQMLVLQTRHAISISAITIRNDGRELSFLVRTRAFQGFPKDVLVWPGDRLRGTSETVMDELKKYVLDQTGVTIRILPWHDTMLQPLGHSKVTPSERIASVISYDAKNEKGIPHRNELFVPPLVIMRQPRPQENGVPGHIDMIYLSEEEERTQPKPGVSWIREKDLDNHRDYELWPDIKECFRRAAKAYRQQSQHSPPQ